MEEPEYDKVTQASLNGIYVKAQEMDRGHNDAPAPSFLPPGAKGDADTHASTHASDANAHASNAAADAGAADAETRASDAETHASDAQAHASDAESHASTHASDGV